MQSSLVFAFFCFFCVFFITAIDAQCSQQHCAANSTCCGAKTNVLCCISSGPLQESCCDDAIQGPVCCLKQETFCCPRSGPVPSRCCPNWYICCPGLGRYGCCDPGNGRVVEDNIGYALFAKAGLSGGDPMKLVKIDLASGKKTEMLTSFNTYGEIPRSFVWAPSLSSFILPQADFLSPTQNISLSIINAQDASSTQVPLQGPSGLVTGFCWASQANALIFATYSSPAKQGYTFYRVTNVATGAFQKVASRNFGGQDDYSGWFKRCTPDGNTLYRMGFRVPESELMFGVGVTSIATPSAASNFYGVQTPSGYASRFATFELITPTTFLSLIGSGSRDGPYSVIQWNTTGQTSIVSRLSDAHEAPFFGPIASAIDSTQYGVITTTRSFLGNNYDRWKLSLMSRVTGRVTEHDLSPWMIAETDSVAGFGFPEPTSRNLLQGKQMKV